MQTLRQVWDQPWEWGLHSQMHPAVLGTTNTSVNLGVQCTLFILLSPESLWNSRVFPASKKSHILLKVTTFVKRNLQIKCVLKTSPQLALLGNKSSIPLLDPEPRIHREDVLVSTKLWENPTLYIKIYQRICPKTSFHSRKPHKTVAARLKNPFPQRFQGFLLPIKHPEDGSWI